MRIGSKRKSESWLMLALATLSCASFCYAQSPSGCRNSTVEDAWGPTVASEARSFLGRLQGIIESGDKKQFASLIHYPLRVFDGDRKIEITSRTDFAKKYSSIITSDVRHAILGQSADCLFGNAQGMMIGSGQVWFLPDSSGKMKIITINKTAPKVDE